MTQQIRGAMFHQEEKIEAASPVAEDLEPYRRLIDLQKQMIELVRQHERTKVECAELREQLLNEMAKRNPRWNLRRIIGQPTARWAGYFKQKLQPRLDGRSQTNGSFLPSC